MNRVKTLMFDFGIKILAGLVVEDEERVWRIVAEGKGNSSRLAPEW